MSTLVEKQNPNYLCLKLGLLSLCGGLVITVLSFFIGIGFISFIPMDGEKIDPELVIATVILMHMTYLLIMGGLVRYVWKRRKVNSWLRLCLFIAAPLVGPYLIPRNGLLILGILIVLASLASYDALTTRINCKGT